MNYYSGLDVSLKTTFISIVDETGKIVREAEVPTDIEAMSDYLKKGANQPVLIGIESGQLSIPLCKGLRAKGLNVICIDARQAAAALSARINKNDKNDGRGIAQLMRVGLYREVQIKTDKACQLKLLLGSRAQLIHSRQQLEGTIRGLLKLWNIKLGRRSADFLVKVRENIKGIDTISQQSIEGLLSSLNAIETALMKLDKLLAQQGKEDAQVKLLMSVPGVGILTALTYQVTLDTPDRFTQSETVGAYLGLTPRQYASGEVNRQGSISKMGSVACRSLLYEAAFSLLTRSKRHNPLRSWGLKLAKKKGLKKAAVAVARKLAVIMHRMLIEQKEFCYTSIGR